MTTRRIYRTHNWDQRLYDALFSRSSDMHTTPHCLHLKCLIVRCVSVCEGGAAVRKNYEGSFRLPLSAHEFCEIAVRLRVSDPQSEEMKAFFNFEYDYSGFSWVMTTSEGVQPAIDVVLHERKMIGATLASMYRDSKMPDATPLRLEWVTKVDSLLDLDAQRIWGDDWRCSAADGLPGRVALAVESFRLEVAV